MKSVDLVAIWWGRNLTVAGAAGRVWQAALAWKGRVDVLVNNAGVYEPIDLDADDAAWDAAWTRTLQANLLAPAQLTRAAVQRFRNNGGGSIINIESRAAFRGEGPVYSHYAASKGGLMAFGRTMARAYAGEGVLVYGISPGWIDTDMAAAGIEELGRDYVMRDIPLGEIVSPAGDCKSRRLPGECQGTSCNRDIDRHQRRVISAVKVGKENLEERR